MLHDSIALTGNPRAEQAVYGGRSWRVLAAGGEGKGNLERKMKAVSRVLETFYTLLYRAVTLVQPPKFIEANNQDLCFSLYIKYTSIKQLKRKSGH